METNLESKLREIAIYMGGREEEFIRGQASDNRYSEWLFVRRPEGIPDWGIPYCDAVELMKYNTSLDWLNPVWAKVRKELKEYIEPMTETRPIPDWAEYDQAIGTTNVTTKGLRIAMKYWKAVDTDNVAEAFEVVYSAIQLLKELKK